MRVKAFGKEILAIERSSEKRSIGQISSLENPTNWLLQLLGAFSSAGITVNQETALTLPVYYAGLKVLSEDIAKLPGGVFQKQGESRQQINHPVYNLYFSQPNPIINSFHWRQTMIVQAISHGNHYSRIIRNQNGQAIQIFSYQDPRTVEPYIIDGELWYKVPDQEMPVPAYNIFHIHGMGFNGIKGLPLLFVARDLIGGGLAEQNYSNEIYKNGGLERIAIKVPGEISPDTKEQLQKSWIDKYGQREGANQYGLPTYNNIGKPAVLSAGSDVIKLGINPQEIAMLPSKEFTVEQFARMIRIPLHKLQSMKASTNNNIEQQSKDYVTDSLMPWLAQIEMEAKLKLFATKEQSTHYIRHNLNFLLRGDSVARADYYSKAILNGWLSANEIRALEEMNARDGGDDYLMPVNTWTDEMVKLVAAQMEKNLKESQGAKVTVKE